MQDNKKLTNLRNRPKALEYSDVQAERGTGQLDTMNAYLRSDPVSYFYQKLKDTDNQFLRDDYWAEASKRGESENLISLLQGTQGENFSSEALDILSGYGDRMGYDDYMLALQLPHLDNENKVKRVDQESGYEFGEYTDQEWAWEILKNTVNRWDAQIIEEYKANRSFLETVGVELGHIPVQVGNLAGNALRFVGDIYNVGEGILNTIFNWSKEGNALGGLTAFGQGDNNLDTVGQRFLYAFANDEDYDGWANPFANVGEWLQAASFEWQRNYSGTVSATKAYEQGYRLGEDGNWLERVDEAVGVGTGYNTPGRWLNGAVGAIGYMLPTILLAKVTGGASAAATAAGKTATIGAKAASAVFKARSLIFYAGIFGGTVKDAVVSSGISYKDLNAGEVISNAAIKSVAQYAIERALGAVLGNTAVNRMLGIGGKATGGAVNTARAAAGGFGQAAAQVAKTYVKEGLQEGLEELLQELSDMTVDYAFGGDYRKNVVDNFSIQTLTDAFIIGAMTSIVMGSVKDLVAHSPESGRAHGVNEVGELYKLGYFQSINLATAMSTMQEWNDIVTSDKASVKTKAETMLKMNIVIDTLSDIYKNMGTERAIKADAVINDMLAMKNKTEQLATLKSTADYTTKLWSEFKEAVHETNIEASLEAIIKKDLSKEADRLKKAKVTKIEGAITPNTDPNNPDNLTSAESTTRLKRILSKLGIDAIIAVDSASVMKSEHVVFANSNLIKKGDITAIVQGIAYDLALQTMKTNLTADQKKLILKTYNTKSGTQGNIDDAVTALLFDKDFYTYMLLRTGEGRFGPKSFKTLATIDQMITQAVTPNVKNGTVTEQAYKTLLTKIQKNMQSGLVTFATQYAKIDLGEVSNAILPASLKQIINTHRNVVFTNMINDGLAQKGIASERIEAYNKAIDKFATDYSPQVIASLKAKAASTKINDRVDAYVSLIAMSRWSDQGLGEKTIYLPTNPTADSVDIENAVDIIETAFGMSWAKLTAPNADHSLTTFPEETKNLIDALGYDMNIPSHRLAAMKQVLFHKTGKTMTLTQDFTLMWVIPKADIVKLDYLAENGDDILLADIKSGKVKTIADIMDANIDSKIGSIKIQLAPNAVPNNANGYYVDGADHILVRGTDLVNTIMHEATHIVQNAYDKQSLGGSGSLFKAMDPAERTKLVNYVKENMPIAFSLITSNPKNKVDSALYMLLEGEMQANASLYSVALDAGFTWKADRTILVSPDGKVEWSMKVKPTKSKTSTKPKDTITGQTKLTKTKKGSSYETIRAPETDLKVGDVMATEGIVDGDLALILTEVIEVDRANKQITTRDIDTGIINTIAMNENRRVDIVPDAEGYTKPKVGDSLIYYQTEGMISKINNVTKETKNVKDKNFDEYGLGANYGTNLTTLKYSLTVTTKAGLTKQIILSEAELLEGIGKYNAKYKKGNASEKVAAKPDFDAEVKKLVNIPDTADIDAETSSLVHLKKVDEFYAKYPALKAIAEGTKQFDKDSIAMLGEAKRDSIKLMFREVYRGDGQKGTFEDFIKKPIHFVARVAKDGMSKVSIGYDPKSLPLIGKDSEVVYTGTTYPLQLAAYLPFTYLDGVIDAKRIANATQTTIGDLAAKYNRGQANIVTKAVTGDSTKKTGPIADKGRVDKGNIVYEDNEYRVVNYSDTHYEIFKDAGYLGYDKDDTVKSGQFLKSQIVSKETLLPDGHVTPMLTLSQRKALAGWMAGENKFFGKKRKKGQDDGPVEVQDAAGVWYTKNGNFDQPIYKPEALQQIAEENKDYLKDAYFVDNNGIPLVFYRGFAPFRLNNELHNNDGKSITHRKIAEFYTSDIGTAQTFQLGVNKDYFGEGFRGFITNFKANEIRHYDFEGRSFKNATFAFSAEDAAILKDIQGIHNEFHKYEQLFRAIPNLRNLTLDEFMQSSKVPVEVQKSWENTIKRLVKQYGVAEAVARRVAEYVSYDDMSRLTVDTTIPINILLGYKAVFVRNIDEGKTETTPVVDDLIILYGNAPRRVTVDNSGLNMDELIKAPARYISNKVAMESNLKYFVKKGSPIQVDPKVANFVIGTTKGFKNLPKILYNKILSGKLNYYDITEYVATARRMNDYTFKAIAEHVYDNPELAKLSFKEARALLENTVDLAAISLVIEDDTLPRTLDEMREVQQGVYKAIEKNKKLADQLIKMQKRSMTAKVMNEVGVEEDAEVQIDPKQLMPIMMRHYDGTLVGIRSINNIGKFIAGKQTMQRLKENVDTGAIDTTLGGGKEYNWIDRMRRADIDYDQNNGLEEALDSMDRREKIKAINDQATTEMMNRIKDMPQAEKVRQLKSIMGELQAYSDQVSKLSDAELDSRYLAVVANEVADSNERSVETIVDEIKAQPRSTKNIKDHLRQTARTLTRRIAGMKRRYNSLPDSVKAVIDPKTYKLITENYTKLNDAQLETLLADMKEASTELASSIRTAESTKKKLEQTQARLAKLQEKVMKAPKATKTTMREKVGVVHKTTIVNQTFRFDSREVATETAKALLNTQWAKRTTSQVKGITNNVEQNVHNGKTFFETNSATLMAMTTAEAERTATWFVESNIVGVAADSPEAQTFAAIKLYFLGYILGQARDGGQFMGFNANLRNRVESHLQTQATVAGTSLAVWNNIQGLINPLQAMMNASMEIAGVLVSDEEKLALLDAAVSGDMQAIARAQQMIIERVNLEKTTKKNILRKITTVRSMAMLSSPITWLRNVVSNTMLKHLNQWSSKVGARIASNKVAEGQFKLNGKVTPQIQAFINKEFLDNGMYDTIVSDLSKYNPSDIQARFKDATGKASKDAIFANMVIKSLYNKFYNQNMFNSPRMNNLHKFLMKMLSDNNWVREASVRYFGKIIAERGYDLTKGVTDSIMGDFANAVGLAMADYMHSNNFLNSFETILAEKSEAALFAYKLILPFGSASWNWFKAAMRYSPVGLGQSIYKLAKLEQEIIKAETAWATGKGQVAPEFTEMLIRRNLGSGIIGTTSMIFGMMLAGLGYVELEDDDYGTPKLRIGNLHIDVSTIFGNSSVLAGMALVKGWEDGDWLDAVDSMLDPMLDGFFLVDILQMDQYNNAGWGAFGLNFIEQTLLSFIPNGVRWLSGATYTGKYKTNNFFEKAVSRIPFFGSVFGLEKRVNPYTGSMGNAWDIFNRVVPFLEVRSVSALEDQTRRFGINKAELRGNYEVQGEKFQLSPAQVAELNKAYGQWNADDLVLFYNNKKAFSVRMPNGSYRALTYNQMDDTQRTNAIQNLFNKNAEYAKIKAWLEAGNAYYASAADYAELRKLGLTGNLFKGSRGFVKK